MKIIITLLWSAAVCLTIASPAYAQVYLNGQTYFGGSAAKNDTATAIEVMNGEVMVAGNMVNKGTGTDAVVRKYSPGGTLLWSGGYFSSREDWVQSFQCNLLGALYAVGTTGTGDGMDGLLFKLDANGNTVWTRTYNSTSNGMDVFNNLHLSPDNTVVVVGESFVQGFQCDGHLAKYDAQGNKIWQRAFGNGGENAFTNVQIEESGNIFASGFKYNGANKDGYIAKYSGQGKLLKSVVINGDGNKDDETVSLHLENNMLFAATVSRAKSGYDVAVISAYNPATLALIWTTTYSVPTGDIGLVAGFDCNLYGDLLLSGTQYNGSQTSYLALSYEAASGALNWAKTISRGSGYNDTGIASTLDSNNTYIISGKSATIPNAGSPATDIFTVGLDVKGNLLWKKITDGTSRKNDSPSAIGVNAAGDLFIAGQSQVKTNGVLNDDIALLKYSGTKLCLAPTGLAASSITANAAVVSWDAMPEATKYKLQYRPKGGTWITVNTSTTSKKLTGLTPNTTYEWKVKTVCADDPFMTSDFSAAAYFSTASALQAGESYFTHGTSQHFLLSPNPARNITRITLQDTNEKSVTISVSDMSGKVVQTALYNIVNRQLQVSLNVAQLAQGTYMVSISGSRATYSQLLVKE